MRYSVRILALFLGLLALIFTPAAYVNGKTLTGKVMQGKDGDTVVISPEYGGQSFVCRFLCNNLNEMLEGILTHG